MGGMDFSELNRTLGEMLARARTPEKPLREIGFLMAQEMKENIARGGRPTRWPQSIRAMKMGGQTLRDTGTLMNSITSAVQGRTVAAGPTAVGKEKRSDPRIFGILAYGGTIKAKNKPFLRFMLPGVGWVSKKEVTIPPRDFTYIPPEREVTFGEIVRGYLVEG